MTNSESTSSETHMPFIKGMERLIACSKPKAITKDCHDFKIKLDFDANYIFIRFPGKTNGRVQRNLKEMGFKWSHTVCAWSRKMTADSQDYLMYLFYDRGDIK